MRRLLVVVSLLGELCACSPPAPQAPAKDVVISAPAAAPSPSAPSPPPSKRAAAHQAALQAMLDSGFGYRTDRDHQARFPLPDRKNWLRVRFSMIEHFTGFSYGEDEHSLAIAVVQPLAKDDPTTSAACIQRFEEDARSQVSELGGHLGPTATTMRKWQKFPLVVRTATGDIDILFKHYRAALAWTGFPAYPGHCMIYAVVIPYAEEDKELALLLRERWLDGFKKFKPLTESAPFRHPK
ncbi:MAG TPA: hypothetical protein VN764_10720 [Polyangiaceae bacterium]|nr:hypothetical protein [Polyangiaceae bacterium]